MFLTINVTCFRNPLSSWEESSMCTVYDSCKHPHEGHSALFDSACIVGFWKCWPLSALFPPVSLFHQWFEPSQFGTWWSVLSCSMNLAGSLGPIVVTVLLQYYDWRTILTMSGIFCASFSFVCLVFVKNEPKDVGLPSINAAAKTGAKGGR